MTYFGIHGALGKMGRSIARLAKKEAQLNLSAAFDINADVVRKSGEFSEGITNEILFSKVDRSDLKKLKVLIDFSIPKASLEILELCKEAGIPIVIGTTGFTPEEEKIIESASRQIPVLKSSNMSMGVNLLFALVHMAAQSLKDKNFQIEMMEIHHGRKHDAPSGTAKSLEKIILNSIPLDKNVVYGRSGMIGERKPDELGVFALRGGDVVGDHTVFFLGEGERLELKHQAVNRDIFARGALNAAKYISDKEPGMYTMADVLDLKNI